MPQCVVDNALALPWEVQREWSEVTDRVWVVQGAWWQPPEPRFK